MTLGKRDETLAAEWVRYREVSTTGKPAQAIRLAEQTVASSDDPFQIAQALIAQLVFHHAAKHHDAVPPLLEKIQKQLQAAPHPRLVGEYHVFAAGVAYDRHSYSIALLHLVEAERALKQMDELTRAAVEAWYDLAGMSTILGYHGRALEAADRCQTVCADAGLPPALGSPLYARVHAAAYLDRRGDTAGCVRDLADLVEQSRPLLDGLTVMNLVLLGYALRRLAALDHPIALDVPATGEVGPSLKRINALGDVCDALAARRPDQHLLFSTPPPSLWTPSEPPSPCACDRWHSHNSVTTPKRSPPNGPCSSSPAKKNASYDNYSPTPQAYASTKNSSARAPNDTQERP